MKIIESEVSTGNASGKGGGGSLPFGRGYYNFGINNGSSGIKFTPDGEPSFKTYKSMKHSKKEMKKRNKKKMKKFEDFLTEDAATMGNSGGMGAVTAATPSSTPGDVAGGTPGSGDIGQTLGTYSKTPSNLRKRKDGKYKMKKIQSYDSFRP
jgi:hypothetical protein